jgi:hypothetical protein
MNSSYAHSGKGLGAWYDYLTPSGAVHNAIEKQKEINKITADEVPGNRLKVEKDVRVYLGYVGSNQTEIWKKGFLSPPVYSWVMKDDRLYWMIGELAPFRYVKHDKDTFDIVADYGGGKYLNEDEDTGSFIDLSGPGLGKLDAILKKGLIVAGVGAGMYFLVPFAPAIKSGLSSFAGKFKDDK